MKKRIVTAIMLLVVMVIPSFASAATNPPVLKQVKKSSTIIVGDSRMAGMWRAGYNTTNINAWPGGHYFNAKSILTKERKNAVSSWIDYSLKTHKECKVIIFATINDRQKDRDNSGKKIVAYAKEVAKKSFTYKVNGKNVTVKPKVYIAECPRAKKLVIPGHNYTPVSTYNAHIKSLIKNTNITWVNLRDPKASEYKDNVHFVEKKNGYNKYMWETFSKLKAK